MIRTEIADGIAVIRMDDGKVNAFSFALMDAFLSAFETAVRDANAIIVAGRDGVFSAGLDLKLLRAGAPADAKKLLTRTNAFMRALLAAEIPVVAASTGHAMALGALMLTAFDYRIGARGAFRVGVNATANGVTLPAGLFAAAQARLHPNYLKRSILCAEIFDPAGACDAGYYDELAAPGDVIDCAVTKARSLAALPAQTFAAHKAAFNAPIILEIDAL